MQTTHLVGEVPRVNLGAFEVFASNLTGIESPYESFLKVSIKRFKVQKWLKKVHHKKYNGYPTYAAATP